MQGIGHRIHKYALNLLNLHWRKFGLLQLERLEGAEKEPGGRMGGGDKEGARHCRSAGINLDTQNR